MKYSLKQDPRQLLRSRGSVRVPHLLEKRCKTIGVGWAMPTLHKALRQSYYCYRWSTLYRTPTNNKRIKSLLVNPRIDGWLPTY